MRSQPPCGASSLPATSVLSGCFGQLSFIETSLAGHAALMEASPSDGTPLPSHLAVDTRDIRPATTLGLELGAPCTCLIPAISKALAATKRIYLLFPPMVVGLPGLGRKECRAKHE